MADVVVTWLDTGRHAPFVYHTRDCGIIRRERLNRAADIKEAATPPAGLRLCESCRRGKGESVTR